MDVLAANKLATRLFGLPEGASLARFVLLEPAARDLYVEWDDTAAAIVGCLRLAAGRHPADRRLAELIADLSRRSPKFRECWAAGEVDLRSSGVKRLRHPALGILTLQYENFTVAGDDTRVLVTLTPEPATPTEAAFHLLSTWSCSAAGEGAGHRPPVRSGRAAVEGGCA